MKKTQIIEILKLALAEDLGENGDITSSALMQQEWIKFKVNPREGMTICGIPIIRELFSMYNDEMRYTAHKHDGQLVTKNETIISGEALGKTLFSIERLALNILQHLSGIASLTQMFVEAVKNTKAIIRDTRKTTPGIRILEKYATSVGGAESLRQSLSDKILIKDNHIISCGGIENAINRARLNLPNELIAIECDNIQQVQQAVSKKVDLILLDNMSIEQIKQAVDFTSGEIKLEASGGVTLENVKKIAETGVDYISVGMITHSATSKDIGLDCF